MIKNQWWCWWWWWRSLKNNWFDFASRSPSVDLQIHLSSWPFQMPFIGWGWWWWPREIFDDDRRMMTKLKNRQFSSFGKFLQRSLTFWHQQLLIGFFCDRFSVLTLLLLYLIKSRFFFHSAALRELRFHGPVHLTMCPWTLHRSLKSVAKWTIHWTAFDIAVHCNKGQDCSSHKARPSPFTICNEDCSSQYVL